MEPKLDLEKFDQREKSKFIFKAGAILLSGLFIYDVFWVFATDVVFIFFIKKSYNALEYSRYVQIHF